MKRKIVIAGIGGVGGYLGVKLAHTYSKSTEVEIYFLARGEHLKAIQQEGLKVHTDEGLLLAHPAKVSDHPADFGKLDLIIFCCKSYSLESVAQEFKENIHQDTLLLPLLNGVMSVEVLKSIFPNTHCLHGCVYIVSKILSPGEIIKQGKTESFFFGNAEINEEILVEYESLFKAAGINATLLPNIIQKTWEKFCFIAPIATLTSALNKPIGEIIANEEHLQTFKELINEVYTLALKKGIFDANDQFPNPLEVAMKLPYETTSSMHGDFSRGSATELETLTGFVVRESNKWGIEAKQFTRLYDLLLNK
jgi:2-dehydropantoate 2-reductase